MELLNHHLFSSGLVEVAAFRVRPTTPGSPTRAPLGDPCRSLAAGPAVAQFVGSDVQLLQLFEGDQIADVFGWVAAELPDLDCDGVNGDGATVDAEDFIANERLRGTFATTCGALVRPR